MIVIICNMIWSMLKIIYIKDIYVLYFDFYD